MPSMWKKQKLCRRESYCRCIAWVTNGRANSSVQRRCVCRESRGAGQIMSDLVVGIDLGTTNSEIAAFVDGQVRVLGPNQSKMLPSCVGISPTGELLVGTAALNQQRIYPERTVR